MHDIHLKLPPQVRNYVVSPSSGAFTAPGNDGVETAVTGVELEITTHGRPVLVWLAPDGTTNASGIVNVSTSTQYAIHRDDGATDVRVAWPLMGQGTSNRMPTMLAALDAVAAGTYTYYLTYYNRTSIAVHYCRLVAWELGT